METPRRVECMWLYRSKSLITFKRIQMESMQRYYTKHCCQTSSCLHVCVHGSWLTCWCSSLLYGPALLLVKESNSVSVLGYKWDPWSFIREVNYLSVLDPLVPGCWGWHRKSKRVERMDAWKPMWWWAGWNRETRTEPLTGKGGGSYIISQSPHLWRRVFFPVL